jgi:hypothetical protein
MADEHGSLGQWETFLAGKDGRQELDQDEAVLQAIFSLRRKVETIRSIVVFWFLAQLVAAVIIVIAIASAQNSSGF